MGDYDNDKPKKVRPDCTGSHPSILTLSELRLIGLSSLKQLLQQ